MRIFLIGLPGSGKTTLGKKLANALGVPFLDLDNEIEKTVGKSIPEIFKSQGEEAFRKLESQHLRACVGSKSKFVIATGGGAPCFYSGIEVMNQSGISVFLDVPIETIVNRMSEEERLHRPLLASGTMETTERLSQLLEKRLPYYAQATVTVKGSEISLEEVIRSIDSSD